MHLSPRRSTSFFGLLTKGGSQSCGVKEAEMLVWNDLLLMKKLNKIEFVVEIIRKRDCTVNGVAVAAVRV